MRSCVTPVQAVGSKAITTIEGLSTNGTHPVQLAWKEFDVPQCGYCQSGQILAAVALLSKKPKPTDDDIDAGMGNACKLWDLPPDSPGHSPGRGSHGSDPAVGVGRSTMSAKADRPNGQSNPEEKLDAKEKIVMDRRAFLAGTSAAAGGAAVFGFFLPSGSAEAAEAPKSVAKAVAKSTVAAPGSVPPGSLRLGGVREGTAVAAQPWYHEATVPEINAWITIAPDETVTIRIGQTELGTGVLTCNSMIIAEELQCDWSKVRCEYADANRDYENRYGRCPFLARA